MPFRKFGAPEKGDVRFDDTDDAVDVGAGSVSGDDATDLDDLDDEGSPLGKGSEGPVREARDPKHRER